MSRSRDSVWVWKGRKIVRKLRWRVDLIIKICFLLSMLDSDSDSFAVQINLEHRWLGHQLQHDCPPGKMSITFRLNRFMLFLGVFSQICSHVAAYTNSCLNPILYAKMSRNFRCGFSQVGAGYSWWKLSSLPGRIFAVKVLTYLGHYSL